MRERPCPSSALFGAVLLLLSVPGCDFNRAAEKCRDAGRCESPDGSTLADGGDGPTDGGADPDGGEDPDGGVLPDGGVEPCDGDFVLGEGLCRGGWCWKHPLPHGNPVRAVHGRGGPVYAVGDHGTVMRITGCEVESTAMDPSFAVQAENGHPASVHVLRSGGVVVALGDQLLSLQPGGHGWEKLRDRHARALWELPDGTLLQGSSGSGGGIYVGITASAPINDGWGRVHRFSEDAQGPLALTAGGLIRGGDDWELAHPLDAGSPGSIHGLYVLPDSGEVVYARGDGELVRYSFTSGTPLPLAPPSAFALTGGEIAELGSVTAGRNGGVLVGSLQGGLYEVPEIGPVVNRAPSGWEAPIFDLHAQAPGSAFAATSQGLLWLRGEAPAEPLEARAIPRTVSLAAIAGDATSACAVAGQSVYCFDGTQWEPPVPLGVTNATLSAATMTPDGTLVVGGDGYLGRVVGASLLVSTVFDRNDATLTPGGNWFVHSLASNSDRIFAAGRLNATQGVVWVSTDEGVTFEAMEPNMGSFDAAVPVGNASGGWGISGAGDVTVIMDAGGTAHTQQPMCPSKTCVIRGLWAEDLQTGWVATTAGPRRCAVSGTTVSCTAPSDANGEEFRGDLTGVIKVGEDVVFFGTAGDKALGTATGIAWRAVTNGAVSWELEEIPAPPAAGLLAAFRSPSGHVWMAGNGGAVLQWTPPPPP